ncbi:MAG: dienelactone hydrolase family protein [Bacteroidales bacterium]
MLGISSIGKSGSLSPNIKEVNVAYISGGVTYKGFIAYDDNIKGKRPAILIVPEWWGLNDYPRMRARKLAELGYVAMAADVFGNGKIAVNPTEAQEFTTPFYKDPTLSKKLLDAALRKLKELPQTDVNNVAAIGYCFGGYMVLNYAKLGADVKGVVSFHGGMGGVPVDKKLLKAKILVCQGGSDKFVSQKDVDKFKNQLDSIGAINSVKVYANATHAFTNPDATATGIKFSLPIGYNAEADKASWDDMKMFFGKIFNK